MWNLYTERSFNLPILFTFGAYIMPRKKTPILLGQKYMETLWNNTNY